ncbi:hypothetical protein F5888DRAFT_1825718 [Russula emetica]|nr:hypothetical protein F5888DRAFT_1642167 [Russula emetica]KAF8488613.1 hypothetical protein F5888DRAFT_1639117 [Russula emetica]KAF8490679.1 hypothetical protein F5888DRAFT_1638008 [Russula emetica]KAF8491072.1 hypothetical protein F5888DRAFT_1637799 [Russula emetica]KAF8491216.1 hypothetical protein F5888DRAFT_1637748 [Russula emetica]
MSRRPLTRSNAVANLKDIQPTAIMPPRLRRQTLNPDDTESDNEIAASGTPLGPNLEHGQPAADNELDGTVAPPQGTSAADSANRVAVRQPTLVNRKVVPPRSPLPSRATRPVHPGAPDMSKPRRTSTEVTAGAKRKAALQLQVNELEQKKIDTLAAMEVEEELADEEEERTVVRQQAQSDGLDNTKDVFMQSEDDENAGGKSDSDAEEILELSTSEEDPQTLKAKKVLHRRSQKKPNRGETRAAVDSVKAKLKAADKKRSASVDLNAISNKKKKANVPSGLTSDWKSKLSAATPRQTSSKVKAKPFHEALGGLEDEDTLANVAETLALSTGHPMTGQKNNKITNVTQFVHIDNNSDSDSESEDAPTKPPAKGAKKSTTADSKALKVSKGKTQPEKTVKATKATKEVPVANPPFDISTLPEFARTNWSTHFLPTLYDCLGCSHDPFVIGSDIVKPIQAVVNAAYPGSGYRVLANDRLVVMAKGRLHEKRAFFGREAIKIVSDFFKDDAYANKPKATAKYAKWAIRGNGPALFGKPTPVECMIPKGTNGYVEPDGIFESTFIIQLLSQYLKWCTGSCHDYGHPIGALSMAAAGIERAFVMFATGTRTDVGQFSKDVVGTLVGDYLYLATRLTDRRWDLIAELCSGLKEKSTSLTHAVQSQVNRRTLYEPSSSVRASDASEE